MHNGAELSALCGTLALNTEGTNKEKKDRIQKFVSEETVRTHNPEKAYRTLLTYMWEGILFEYLRTQGCPMKTAEQDPRGYTLMYWRKRALEQHNGTFRPNYMPRLVRPRFIDEKLDDDLRALFNGVSAKEAYVKESEKRIKESNDYRNVVMYLSSVTDMHDFEQDARSYLMSEVMMLRGRSDHQNEALDLVAKQSSEMEGKHFVMAEQWCKTLAAQEASVNCYVGMLNDQISSCNALADRVEEFLEHHGGRHANRLHPTLRSDLSVLVPRLLARYHFDLASAASESRRDAASLTAAKKEVAHLRRVLAAETSRADDAEKECRRWAARHEALQYASASRIAQLECELEWLGAEAGSGMVERRIQEKRFALVRPSLMAMLSSGKAAEEAKGASMLEALGMMDRAGMLRVLDEAVMKKEDLRQHTDIALSAASKVVSATPTETDSKTPTKKGAKKKR